MVPHKATKTRFLAYIEDLLSSVEDLGGSNEGMRSCVWIMLCNIRLSGSSHMT